MLNIKFIGYKQIYNVEFSRISDNIVKIVGDFPARKTGFTISRPGYNDKWNYSEFTTIYKRDKENGIVMYSNDGSVYVEPEPPKEPDPPTEEELEEMERPKKISEINAQIAVLKSELDETDYIYIKAYEAYLAGETVDYDLAAEHEKRQAIRDKINELESELEIMG